MFTSRPPHVCVGHCSPDALVSIDDHRRRDFVLCDPAENRPLDVNTLFRVNHGFMTAFTRAGFSGMRQADEDQLGASGIARQRGVELGSYPLPRRSERGSRDSKQHQEIQKTRAGAEMRGRTP